VSQRKFSILRLSFVGSGALTPVHRQNFVRVLGGSRRSFVGGSLGARLRERSNFYCHPGRAGGTPMLLAFKAVSQREGDTARHVRHLFHSSPRTAGA